MTVPTAHPPHACALLCLPLLSPSVAVGESNRLSEEKRQGFVLLFNGKSMDGWRNYMSEDIRPQWQVIDGAMVLTAKGGRDLVTKETFRHFDLRLEDAIAKKGSSRILFRVVEDSEEKNPWRLAPQYQLYDSYNVKVHGERCAGALYGLLAAPTGLARKPGEWDGTWSWRHVLDKKLVTRSAASEPRP